ncbi:MAG: hypothetical protein AAGF82_18870, partial [Pseudomonadota bacterium]
MQEIEQQTSVKLEEAKTSQGYPLRAFLIVCALAVLALTMLVHGPDLTSSGNRVAVFEQGQNGFALAAPAASAPADRQRAVSSALPATDVPASASGPNAQKGKVP